MQVLQQRPQIRVPEDLVRRSAVPGAPPALEVARVACALVWHLVETADGDVFRRGGVQRLRCTTPDPAYDHAAPGCLMLHLGEADEGIQALLTPWGRWTFARDEWLWSKRYLADLLPRVGAEPVPFGRGLFSVRTWAEVALPPAAGADGIGATENGALTWVEPERYPEYWRRRSEWTGLREQLALPWAS